MGIDPEAVKRAEKEARKGSSYSQTRQHRRRNRHTHRTKKIIPPEYGEYIDFEVLSISGNESWLQDSKASPVFMSYNSEKQITDVKFIVL